MAADWLPKRDRLAVYHRDNMQCAYCGKHCKPATQKGFTNAEQIDWMRVHYKDFATLDHVISQYELFSIAVNEEHFKRLIQDITNLVTVCNACNASKNKTELKDWATKNGLDYKAIQKEVKRRTRKPVNFTNTVRKNFLEAYNL